MLMLISFMHPKKEKKKGCLLNPIDIPHLQDLHKTFEIHFQVPFL